MKKRLLTAVAVSALLLGGLVTIAACGGKTKPGEESKQNQVATYRVTCAASEDYEVKGLKEAYAEGETVRFTVEVKGENKILAFVRQGSKKLTAAADGSYSFVMPAEDVVIKISVGELATPVLNAFYSGNPQVGETITITTKIDSEDNDTFNVAAKSGGDLVTINGHNVTLNQTGRVVLEVTATKDSYNLSTELALTIYENEAGLGTNIAYNTNIVQAGTEAQAGANAGKWLYWAGDGGVMNSFTYNAATEQYTVDYSVGWAWYGVQLFYSLPYAQNGDVYKLRWNVESTVAGKITISGHQITLVEGQNFISIDLNQGNGSTISLQMGIDGQGIADNGVFKFSNPRIYDANTANVYRHVSFYQGNELLKDIYVKNGNTVSAPDVTAPEGQLFAGFFDGETKYDSALVPNKDYTFVARFEIKTAENSREVTIMLGDEVLYRTDVFVGEKLILPSNLNYGFGRVLKNLYTNQACTTLFSLNSAITEDITLYAKTQIAYEATYAHDGGLGYKIPNEWIINNADGSVTLKFNGWGSSEKWHIQANFDKSLIVGNVGERYRISFTYSINKAGADVQIYYSNTGIDTHDLEVGDNKTSAVTYDGGILTDDAKLTFELGGTPLDQETVFTLHDISIAKI